MASQSGKGKRRQTAAKQLKRAGSRKRAAERHAANREAQKVQEKNNAALRAAGEWTRWEESEAIRASWRKAGFKNRSGTVALGA